MDSEVVDNVSRISRESISQISHSSIKSNGGGKSSEKDVHFSKISSKNKHDNKKCTVMGAEDTHSSDPATAGGSGKGQSKMIANWKNACDRTRDRTRDLLKRWRTLPEFDPDQIELMKKTGQVAKLEKTDSQADSCGWSVHVWTTWVDRFSVDTMDEGCWESDALAYQLTPIQSHKFSDFFTHLLDHDQDELINEQDFEALVERLRHFADWSTNSPEYNILREIERGFIDTFLQHINHEKIGFQVNNKYYLTIDGWLLKWAKLVTGSKTLNDFPIWLQYFVKVLFQVVNRSSSGIITRDELGSFYSSVLGLDAAQVGAILDLAFQAMTSNGDHVLGFRAFRLCFSNYLMGRYPNGSGQFILGASPLPASSALFPVDYSALNAQPEDLEQYAPDNKAAANRRSVIV